MDLFLLCVERTIIYSPLHNSYHRTQLSGSDLRMGNFWRNKLNPDERTKIFDLTSKFPVWMIVNEWFLVFGDRNWWIPMQWMRRIWIFILAGLFGLVWQLTNIIAIKIGKRSMELFRIVSFTISFYFVMYVILNSRIALIVANCFLLFWFHYDYHSEEAWLK